MLRYLYTKVDISLKLKTPRQGKSQAAIVSKSRALNKLGESSKAQVKVPAKVLASRLSKTMTASEVELEAIGSSLEEVVSLRDWQDLYETHDT
ncbi:hypothetical protein TorRG33x02_182450 [Trema orientale]|uniref:Uncharacterized protein n=1 Tax=Trema orientale TaxID=63057 RepID=A0A2P5EK52_TREOI|nr:hypothetical protein TorRG33x02_182450 [Trema orientale]